MQHPHVSTRRRKSRRLERILSVGVVATVTAATVALSGAVAYADPEPPPPAPAPAPADPGVPPPPPGDPNAPPPPAAAPGAPGAPGDPDAPPPPPPPEPGRVNNTPGGFSYVVPAGWQVSDNTNLSYGQALLTKAPAGGTTAASTPATGGTTAPADTSVLLGRLDLKLFAGAENDDAKAATRLASDMGEFFLPYAGTRVNQAAGPLTAAGLPGAFSSYDVKFTDTTKPDGQIWAGVIGSPPDPGTPRGQRAAPQRWFVVWLGSAKNPIDKDAATVLAQSIRPYTPPPPPPPAEPDPNAPPPDPNAPKPRPGIGVPVPVTDAPPGMMPGG